MYHLNLIMRPTLNRINQVVFVATVLLLSACSFSINPGFPIPDCEPYYTSLRGRVTDSITLERMAGAEITLHNVEDRFDCPTGEAIPELHLTTNEQGIFQSEPMLINVGNVIEFVVSAPGCESYQAQFGVQAFVYDDGLPTYLYCGNPLLETQQALPTADTTEESSP